MDPPNKEALTGTPPERITYAELTRAVQGTASALVASGIGKDDIVIVQLPNCWELAMLYLAVARARRGHLAHPDAVAIQGDHLRGGTHRGKGPHHGRGLP